MKGLSGLEQVRIDMYEVSDVGKISIYEGKMGNSSVGDVRQLQMYWDGLIYDGIKSDKAFLVVDKHLASVKSMVRVMNTFKDQNGNNYNFDICSWDDL